jgi:diguanylate cyclase (GGDEF)-like protein/PAS domain S-box-containing protein
MKELILQDKRPFSFSDYFCIEHSFTEIILFSFLLCIFIIIFLFLIKRIKKLYYSNQKYRIFFNESPDPQLLIFEGIITECNKSAMVLWNLDRSGIIGRHPGELSPSHQPDGSDSITKASEYINEALKEGQRILEWQHIRPDGSIFWIEVILKAVKLSRKTGIIATMRDITARKKAEDGVIQEQRRLRQIIDLVPHFIFAKDEKGRFFIVNKAVADAYGTTVEELTGKCDYDFALSKAEADHFRSGDLEVLNSGKMKIIPEEVITISSGETRILNTIKIPFTTSGTSSPAILGFSMDITDKLAAEQKLLRSEEKFRILVENINDVIFSSDINGTCTYISPVVEKLFGYKPEEVTGKSFEAFAVDEDISGLTEDFRKTIGGEGKPYEFRVHSKNGDIRTVITSSTILYDNGKPIGLIGVLTDFTEIKKNEAELREALNYRRAILDQTAVGIIITYKDRIIHEVNNRACDIFGYSIDELTGRSFRLIHISDENFQNFAVYYEHLKEKGIITIDIPFKKKDNSLIWCYACGTFLDPDRPDKGIIWTIVDITEQKKAEETIRSSQQKLSLLIQQTILAVIEWDRDFRVRAWNPAAENVFGYTTEEAIGRTAEELIMTESSRSQILDVWRNLLSQTGGENSRNENRTKNGEIIICEWYSTPLVDNNGITTGVVSMAFNVTQREQLNKSIRESEKKLDALIKSARDGVILINSEGEINLWNDAASKIFGYTKDEALGRNLHTLITPPRLLDAYIDRFIIFRDAGDSSFLQKTIEMTAMKKGGEEFPVELSLSSLNESNGWSAVGIVRDITERRRFENQLYETNAQLSELTEALTYQAFYDSLTGIFNRRAILEHLDKEHSRIRREGGTLCAGILDIDLFKSINDSYGHQAGDAALRHFAAIVKKNLREYDSIGRYGGEEFLVVATGCDEHDAIELFSRLCKAVEINALMYDNKKISITVSGGVCIVNPEMSIDQALAEADSTLYRAKISGRNRIYFSWNNL